MLEILFEDEHLVAINKPHGMLVHRSKIAKDAKVFALQELRNQVGCWVSPCHRLDRKTGGVLLFSKSEESDKIIKKQFENREVSKKYLALVRGWLKDNSGVIERNLLSESGKEQEAITYYRVLDRLEINKPVGKFQTGRFTLIEVEPKTGRMHQIRRHFAQFRHYIINDKTHGDCKQNKFFEKELNVMTMMLHAKELEVMHPVHKEKITIKAGLQTDFQKVLKTLSKPDEL